MSDSTAPRAERVELGYRDEGNSLVSVDPTQPLPVRIVSERGPTITVDVNVAAVGGAYSAGDAVGGVFEIPSMARIAGGGGIIQTVTLIDDAAQAIAATLYLFSSSVAATADNAAYAPSDADMRKSVGFVPITSFPGNAPSNNQVGVARGVGLGYSCSATSLYGQLQTNGAPTYALNSVWLRITAVRD